MRNNSLYLNCKSLGTFRSKYSVKVAVIARPDWYLEKYRYKHVVIETKRGLHERCFLTEHNGIPFLVVYGRFDRIRTTSRNINFILTQEVVSSLGIETLVGTFSCGSIKATSKAGDIYILDNLVGMGAFEQTRNGTSGFRNVDMLEPFCTEGTKILRRIVKGSPFPVHKSGTYVCFHGYPRIETGAELAFYAKNGWDVVGQTADPEATLAREAGCHYVALAATIDDRKLRNRFLKNDPNARRIIERYILEGRKKTFDIFLSALPKLLSINGGRCNCRQQANHVSGKSKFFEYLPTFMME